MALSQGGGKLGLYTERITVHGSEIMPIQRECRRTWGFAFVLVHVFALGCGGGGTAPTAPPPPPPPPPPPAGPAQLSPVTPQSQTAPVAEAVTVTVRLVTSGGAGVAGFTVLFAVTGGNGSVNTAAATTDAQGQATTVWTLGTVAGTNTLTATASNVPPVTFTATGEPGLTAALVVVAGNGQSARVGSPVPIAPVVRIVDRFQNGIPGVPITFAVTLGGGMVSAGSGSGGSVTITSDAQGLAATTSWTLGLFSTQHLLTVTVPHLPAAIFGAAGLSGWTVNAGNGLVSVSRPAEEGSLFGSGPPWNNTILLTPPLLSITCSVQPQLILVTVFNSLMITQSGIVTWAFDNGPTQAGTWTEGTNFNILIHPGPQTATKLFVSTLALSQRLFFTFRDFRFGALFAPLFDIRGLALVLPQITAACP